MVRSAPDAVPDRTHGRLIYRGGGEGALVPRRPRPAPVVAAAPLPGPEPYEFVRLGADPEGMDVVASS